VLALVAEGRTNRQIGQELFITPKTASIHVSRILAKLGGGPGRGGRGRPPARPRQAMIRRRPREVMRSTTTVRPSTGVGDRPREPENMLVRRVALAHKLRRTR
jgi:Bacterial regulatory proteins, luxR family